MRVYLEFQLCRSLQDRMDGIESKRRNRPVEETLAVWKEMVAGSAEGKKHCMRFKINMQDPNKAMRDPVAYRCNDTAHWRTGTKYKASPYAHQAPMLFPRETLVLIA